MYLGLFHRGCFTGAVSQGLFHSRLCITRLFSILENMLIGYADNSTVTAVVSALGVRVTVAESLKCDLGKVRKRCHHWG